ncbi:hypothetical protein LOTGIDRAFT_228271 [Lottia gigantea]|uniref:Uncharacterized protein n=1 Tax=Lottia gigantea TaxID=225164 RepID=V4C7I4_LOTGI|nr:hypothetical protein LOTGIDRAFT_228271 [Lottia gigantea]ESO97654.1 hypothetical protein LOTGIDRAFT_228271 [Lottia gigantea]
MDPFNVFRVTFLGMLICFNANVECGTSGCYNDYQQCYDANVKIERPQSLRGDWTSFCNAANTLDSCLKNDKTSCGLNDAEPQEYSKYVDIATDSKKSCKVVDCATNGQKCTASLASNPKCTDINNLKSLKLAEGVNCCKIGTNTKTCLQDCGDNNIISSDPLLRQSEALCRGYNDYCSGMDSCFADLYQKGGFSDPSTLCKNVDSFIACIENKCANKGQIGRQTLSKIREVYKDICGVVVKYPTVGSCKSFTSCIENAPSLPGTVTGNIPSFMSARDTDRWCQVAKYYISCGVAAKSCNLGADYTSDVSKVQANTNQTCTGVRGPCPSVLGCLKFGNTPIFRDICPKIPEFVTCTDDALKGCGDGSRVNAAYSLSDVKDLYVETCDAMNDELYQCTLVNSCLDLLLPLNAGDMIYELSDQTSWCRNLNRMLKCTADVSTACKQPKSVHDKFMMLYNKVIKLCPDDQNNSSGGQAGARRYFQLKHSTNFIGRST